MEFSLIFQYRVKFFQVELIRDICVILGCDKGQKIFLIHLLFNILFFITVGHVFIQYLTNALVKFVLRGLFAHVGFAAVKSVTLIPDISGVTCAVTCAEKAVIKFLISRHANKFA